MVIVQFEEERLTHLIKEAVSKALKESETQKETAISVQEQERFLNIKDASRFLGVTVQTMCGKVSKGEVPVIKRGKRLYFSDVELKNYLKEREKKNQC